MRLYHNQINTYKETSRQNISLSNMSFCDSHNFEIDDLGIARHKRDGDSYAERLIDGVAIDTTLFWESSGYSYYDDPDLKEEIIGERKISDEIQEVTKAWGKEKGEGKFYRKRRVPKKKSKNYPTKPKPKNSWHKRLSKISLELGNLDYQTEENAWAELEDSHCEIYNAKKIKEAINEEKIQAAESKLALADLIYYVSIQKGWKKESDKDFYHQCYFANPSYPETPRPSK